MKLRTKLIIPVFSILIILGLLTGFFTQSVLSNIVDFVHDISKKRIYHQVEKSATEDISRIYEDIDRIGRRAMDQAFLFSEYPGVREAYQDAVMGNIDDESDPIVRDARNDLKRLIKPIIPRYLDVTGKSDFRLHFHLANNRSFARTWRDGWQANKNGQQLDISDDLSDFRHTVVKINQGDHKPIHGIEVGRGGFVIRGITPVTGVDGTHLGSCEVYFSFQEIMQLLSGRDELKDHAFYMDAGLLSTATSMKDNQRFPVLENRYVLSSASSKTITDPLISIDFLDEARKRQVSRTIDQFHLTGAPIRDFSGKTIGVAVLAQDIASQLKTLEETRMSGEEAELMLLWEIVIGVVVALILVFILFSILLNRVVLRPLDQCLDFADRISQGDLTVSLDIHQTDEIGRLVEAFRKIVDSFTSLVKRISGDIVQLSSNSNELSTISQQVSKTADLAADKAQAVASATEESSSNMNTIAAASEEASTNLNETSEKIGRMNTTISDISQNAKRANTVSDRAVELVTSASEKVDSLEKAAKEIDKVTEVISAISGKTDLLALNATVEAARAGEAGKGFAVVANEIKALANRTADSTKEIQAKIRGIQDSTSDTISDIKEIEEVISDVHDIIFGISASVEEQAGTTTEIADNMNHATLGINEVAQNIAQSSVVVSEIAADINSVSQATSEFTSSSAQIATSAEDLANIARALKQELTRFKTASHSSSGPQGSRSDLKPEAAVAPLMKWDASFVLNIPEVDKQHKQLVDLVNQLHAAMKQQKDKSEIGNVLKGLGDYTVSHFSDEEKLMRQAGYNQLSAHQEIHKDLIAEILEFQAQYDAGDAMVSMELMDFLKTWLTDHIKGTDRQYASTVIEWLSKQDH